MSTAPHWTRRPVAGIPSRLPVWVALTTRRKATRSLFAMTSWTSALIPVSAPMNPPRTGTMVSTPVTVPRAPPCHTTSGVKNSRARSAVRPDLVGRRRERELLEKLLESARAGRGAVVVVHGEPGVGKTALLDYVVQKGDSFRIARTVGVEGEIELPFAALQQLCAPILALRMGLPPPQRDALGVAFGLAPGNAPSPFLVGLAVLGLLAEVAEDQPLLCVVDDAQWLDQASAAALAFVARRFVAEKVALLFATRAVGETLVGLPELRVEPLGHEDARALLASFLPAPVDAQVLEQVVVETRGNPLGLLELPRGLTPAQIAGGFGLPAAVPVHTGIEALFAQRLAALPPDARLLLLVAAADATGDAALMWRGAPPPRAPPPPPRPAASPGV